jgi:hypothetical protein
MNGYIIMLSRDAGDIEITESEYNAIRETVRNKPAPPEGYDYRLKDDLSWELYALPESDPADNDPELSAEEALEIIVNGGAENA